MEGSKKKKNRAMRHLLGIFRVQSGVGFVQLGRVGLSEGLFSFFFLFPLLPFFFFFLALSQLLTGTAAQAVNKERRKAAAEL